MLALQRELDRTVVELLALFPKDNIARYLREEVANRVEAGGYDGWYDDENVEAIKEMHN